MAKELHKRSNLQKAIDEAVWINFRHRLTDYKVGVVESFDGGYIIISPNNVTFKGEDFEVLPSDYSDMTYKHIASIGTDFSPLEHWEKICGTFDSIEGELLRFIIDKKIPLEKIVRYELACRGHDKDHKYCGFNKAKEIWLSDE